MKLYRNILDYVTRSAYNVGRQKNSRMGTSFQGERITPGGTYLRTVIVILSVGVATLVTVRIITTTTGGM